MPEKKLMYLGPARPFGLPLQTRSVLSGEPCEIFPQIEPFMAKHPELDRLFVPIPEIPKAKAQLALDGSRLNAAYKSVKAASDAWRAERS